MDPPPVPQRRRWECAGLCRHAMFALWVLELIAVPGQARGDSIFDDDWLPPQRAEHAKPPLPTKPNSDTATARHNPAGQPSVDAGARSDAHSSDAATATAAAPAARQAIPSRSDQKRLRKLMREVYAKEIADVSISARKKLAQTLLDEAAKVAGQPVDHYVLLGGAYEAATDARSPRLCFDAADAMSSTFDVDGRAMKLAALVATGRTSNGEDAKALIIEGLEIMKFAAAEDDYDALRKASAAIDLATIRVKDAVLASTARERVKSARLLLEEFARVQKSLATLLVEPGDEPANLSAGRFLCFFKEDWERGRVKLERGSDPALKALAAKELDRSAMDADARLALADAWWDVAEREKDTFAKPGIRRHAAALYEQVSGDLKGLQKSKADKRSAEAAADRPGWSSSPRPRLPRVTTTDAGDAMEAKDIITRELRDSEVKALSGFSSLKLVRHYDASQEPLKRAAELGTEKKIAGSSAKTIWQGNRGVNNFVLFGPYATLMPGKYVLVVRLMLIEAGEKQFAGLGIASNGKNLIERPLRVEEAPLNQWRAFVVPVETTKELKRVEFRVWQSKGAVAVDRIYLFRVE